MNWFFYKTSHESHGAPFYVRSSNDLIFCKRLKNYSSHSSRARHERGSHARRAVLAGVGRCSAGRGDGAEDATRMAPCKNDLTAFSICSSSSMCLPMTRVHICIVGAFLAFVGRGEQGQSKPLSCLGQLHHCTTEAHCQARGDRAGPTLRCVESGPQRRGGGTESRLRHLGALAAEQQLRAVAPLHLPFLVTP